MQRKIMPAVVPVIASILLLTSLCLLQSLKPANALVYRLHAIEQESGFISLKEHMGKNRWRLLRCDNDKGNNIRMKEDNAIHF